MQPSMSLRSHDAPKVVTPSRMRHARAMSDFVEARSKFEAVTRISAVTGAEPERLGPGSKERKSALLNLAAGLDVRVDASADKVRVGAQLAAALGVPWTEECWSTGQTITLAGLNRILEGADREVARRQRPAAAPRRAVKPARGKLEAVTRISALVGGGVEVLGPGSTERKSVLIGVARGVPLTVDLTLPKPGLAEHIVLALGGSWDDSCWSAGQTITLEGLNRILLPLETRVGTTDRPGPFRSVEAEAEAMLSVLVDALPTYMDGRTCVQQMLAAEDRHWAQDEWRGFYFEFVGLPALVNAFAGSPVLYANTSFDYRLGDVWDLKVHGSGGRTAVLNDLDAIHARLDEGGLGFLVLTGDTDYDDGELRLWHAQLRLAHGRKRRPRLAEPSYRRRSKRGFTPNRLDAVHVPDRAALEGAIGVGAIQLMRQGRQASGNVRKPKYMLNLKKAREAGLVVAELDVGATQPKSK